MYSESVDKVIEHPGTSLSSMFEEAALKYKDNIAIVFEEEQISYEELYNRVNKLATAWNDLGLQKNDRIGLMISNHPYYVYSYFAALKLGLIVVQINPYYTLRELVEIIKDSQAEYIVTEEKNEEKINQLKSVYDLTCFYLEKESEETPKSIKGLLSNYEPMSGSIPINIKDDVAVIQYTGGTSGVVKGAMLTHYNLVANVTQTYTLHKGKMRLGKEVVLTATPLYHVFGMTSAMIFGISIGATNILMRSFEVNHAIELIENHRVTYFPGVPKMYSAFVKHPNIKEFNLSSLQYCSCGSAPLPLEIIRKFEKVTNSTIEEGFGMTETCPTTHRNPPGGIRKIGSVGIPIPSTDSKVVDEVGIELPENAIGELIIKGPQVMKGYWNNKEETSKAIKDGWLYTGDYAQQDEDGYFYIVGRKKEMIIVGGFNIYPQEVENIIYEFPNINEVAVAGVVSGNNEEEVRAFIAPRPGCEINLEELRGHCYKNLTPYKVPKQFIVMESLPRNSVGKILKRELIE